MATRKRRPGQPTPGRFGADKLRDIVSVWQESFGAWLRKFALSIGIDITNRAPVVVGPPALEHDARPASQSMPSLEPAARLEIGGLTVTTAGLLTMAFLLQVLALSPIFYARQQQVMFDEFRYELANGTAPVGQVDQNDLLIGAGSPVAVMKIAAINLETVVVEGTSSGALMSGVGHRRDSPLPGQYGNTVLYGRQFSYGGPFARIGELKPGSKIHITTGQGVSTYSVYDIRYTGDPLPEAVGDGGRLTLVSAAGVPFMPNTVVRVDAKLMSEPNVTPAQMFSAESLDESEAPLAGDPRGWAQLALILVFTVLLIIAMAYSLRLWGPRQTWVVATPLLLALGIAIGTQVSVVLPNLL